MKKRLSLVVAFVLFLSIVCNSVLFTGKVSASENGFYINGTTLYDANGNPFVMRGVNHAFCWYMGQENTAIPAIAATGANCVRIVLADGQQWTKTTLAQLQSLISLCEANKLVAIFEIHDATGFDSTTYLDNAVNYWIEMKSALIGHENTVIINIANEWYGRWDGQGWASGYTTAIPKLRDAGIKNTLIVDCAGWGQYPQSIFDYGKTVAATDTLKNTMFAIHMYEYAGKNEEIVKSNINKALDTGYPVCIEEFGIKHTNGDVDDATIMSYCTEKNVGYLGWSWKGNSSEVAYLDMVSDWAGTTLTEQGQAIINGPYGIKATSQICTVYTKKDAEVPTAPTNLTCTGKSDVTVKLSWTASTDDVGVKCYEIYNDSTLVGSSTTTSYTVTGLTPSKSYNFTVKAKDASGKVSDRSNVVSVTTDASGTDESIAGNIKVTYQCDNASASTNSIKPNFQIYNTGTTPINLSDIKVRYYYTDELKKSQNVDLYWATSGISAVTTQIIKMETPKTNADSYVEFGFTRDAGILAPGAYVEVHDGFKYLDWDNYTQTNDYSFNASATSFIESNTITGYISDKIAWGKEPA